MKIYCVTKQVSVAIPTSRGSFNLIYYSNTKDAKEHLALVMGNVTGQENVLTRVHSECFTGEVLGSLRCDCADQLIDSMDMIGAKGQGVIIYLRQEGRGIGLLEKLKAYQLQDMGLDTIDANLALGHQSDERDYDLVKPVLEDLQVKSIDLITNNPMKIDMIKSLGIVVKNVISIPPKINEHNRKYIKAKVTRMQHNIEISEI